MLKIIIENGAYGLLNMGDIAMLKVTESRLRSLFPNAEIWVVTDSADRLHKILPNTHALLTKEKNTWLNTFNIIGKWQHLFPRKLKQWLATQERRFRISFPDFSLLLIGFRFGKSHEQYKLAKSFVNRIKNADLIIAAGGGYINDSFHIHANTLLDVMLLAQKFNRPTILMGQGLGPINNKTLRDVVSHAFQSLRGIGIRESIYSNLIALNVGKINSERVWLTGDDAIELAHSFTPSSLGAQIGVNLRISDYSGITEEVIRKLGKILLDYAETKNCDFKIIPISFTHEKSDYQQVISMIGQTKTTWPDDAIETTVEEIIKAASCCRVVVTASYHAAVFSLSQGIPIIAIIASPYYASKFNGLNNQFPGGVYIIDLNSEKWEANLIDSLNCSWDGAAINRNKLLALAKSQIQAGQEAYTKIRSIICISKIL